MTLSARNIDPDVLHRRTMIIRIPNHPEKDVVLRLAEAIKLRDQIDQGLTNFMSTHIAYNIKEHS
jgi:hypothetical protein